MARKLRKFKPIKRPDVLPDKAARTIPKRFEALQCAFDGATPEEIAASFGYSSADNARLAIRRAMDELAVIADSERARRKEVRKCLMLERLSLREYRRSCEGTVTTREVLGDEGVVGLRTFNPAKPNPTFLKIFLEAMSRHADLQALDLALLRQPDARTTINIVEMSDEQLRSIATRESSGGAGAIEATSSPVELIGVHEVHDADLQCPLVSHATSVGVG